MLLLLYVLIGAKHADLSTISIFVNSLMLISLMKQHQTELPEADTPEKNSNQQVRCSIPLQNLRDPVNMGGLEG